MGTATFSVPAGVWIRLACIRGRSPAGQACAHSAAPLGSVRARSASRSRRCARTRSRCPRGRVRSAVPEPASIASAHVRISRPRSLSWSSSRMAIGSRPDLSSGRCTDMDIPRCICGSGAPRSPRRGLAPRDLGPTDHRSLLIYASSRGTSPVALPSALWLQG